MSALDGGCQVPIGAYARFEGDEIVIDAFVGKLDGSLMLRSSIRTLLAQPVDVEGVEGASLKACALAQQVVEQLEARGAHAILDEVRVTGDERRLV